jgi:hypothetical protein
MYQVATDTQREAGSKTTRTVVAVDEDSHSDAEDDEDEIAAFQNRRNMRFQNKSKKPNSGAQQRNNCYNSGTESNSNRNANIAFTAKSRITPKMNARKESGKINRAETNKVVPTGPKCM